MKNLQSNHPFWHKLTIPVKQPLIEIISNTLFELGAEGIEEETDAIVAYFSSEKDIEWIQKECRQKLEVIRKEFALDKEPEIQIKKIADEDWQDNWKAFFKPIVIDSRLVITTSWESVQAEPGQIVITIDPKQAFGTGGHETTLMMLETMLSYLQSGMRVLDVGTGSGILAIAAKKLGAIFITGFDIDPIAVQTAVENSRLNGIKDIVYFVGNEPCFKAKSKKFDLIFANILTNKLIPLIPLLKPQLNPKNGLIILSGFLDEEKERVTRILEQNDLDVVQERSDNEWLSLVCCARK